VAQDERTLPEFWLAIWRSVKRPLGMPFTLHRDRAVVENVFAAAKSFSIMHEPFQYQLACFGEVTFIMCSLVARHLRECPLR